ncbi:hypothetical protein LTR87_017587 [Friedmanniomyces endolithicus]|nr:hypothetical protein LTR87_017587 [Friedmanniomyces endolithicus]
MTWRNTQRRRSMTLRHDRVMIHVKYHKDQQQTGRYKENIRFLAHPVGELLLNYLVYVMPLRQISFACKALEHSPPHFCGRGAESFRADNPRLHVANWRQITVAIVITKFTSHVSCFAADSDDEDAEEMDDTIKTMTKRRNPKTQTVNRAYANQTGASFGNVWDGLIRMNLRACTLWHEFWGNETMLKAKERRRVEGESRLRKRVAMGVYRPRTPWFPEALLGGAKKLYGNDEMGMEVGGTGTDTHADPCCGRSGSWPYYSLALGTACSSCYRARFQMLGSQYSSCHSFPFEGTCYGAYENSGSTRSNDHRGNGWSQVWCW